MKAVVFSALSALAVNALDSTAYLNGFSQQFGLDQATVQDGLNCVTGIQGAAVQVIQLIQTNQHNIPNLVFQAQGLIEEVQATVAADCQPIAQDVATIVLESTGGEDLKEVLTRNVQLYFPQLIQKVAQYVQYLGKGDDTNAGKTEAYIFQVLLGIEQPETLPVPEFTQYVPFDEKKFFNEYYAAFFNTLGMENVDVASIGQCAEEFQSLTVALGTLINKFSSLDFDGKLVAIKDFVDEATVELQNCEGAFEIQKELLEKALEAAGNDRLGFFLQSIQNLALNFPEYIQLKQKAVIELQEGNYTLAGQDDAKSVELIDGGRIFYN
jgi:hypothetical protein